MLRMKKLILLATIMSSSVFAAHGPAGCGLGSMLFEGKDGLVFNVVAATFNGTSGNQTFGMSTGTLGCEDAKTAKVSAVSFIEGNTVALSNDIARGNGETLNAYLTIINKSSADRKVLKRNFATIFAKGNNAKAINAKITSIL
jgi:hypothetical protein